MKQINVRQIAAETGVSIATISRVINGKSGVGEEKRKLVHAALLKHNYVLNSHLAKERKIALLCGTSHGEYVGELFNGIHEYARKNAINTALIFNNESLKMTAFEQLRDQQCSGVIVIAPNRFRNEFDTLAGSELPVILIDETVRKDGLGFINHDAAKGSKAAAEHLLELGHKNIGYIRYGIRTANHTNRFKAYKTVLKKAGMDIPDHWHVETDADKPSLEAAYQAASQLMEQAPELTAVMTTNDSLAIGAMKAIIDSGKRVPEDISIVGYDNYDFSEYTNPALTTVHHPIREIGFQAAEAINTYFQDPKHTALPQKSLPTQLIIRDSTCPPRKQKPATRRKGY